METRKPTMEEATNVFHAIDTLLQTLPIMCEERTNIMLDGFICLFVSRLTQTVLDAELLDTERLKEAIERGRQMHLMSERASSTIN